MLRNWAIIAGMLVSDFCMCVLMLVHVLMRLSVCVGGEMRVSVSTCTRVISGTCVFHNVALMYLCIFNV